MAMRGIGASIEHGSDTVRANDLYDATITLATFRCVHHNRTYTADVVSYVFTAGDSPVMYFEPSVHTVDIVFAGSDVDHQVTDFRGALIELGHMPVYLGGSFAATITYGVGGCAFSASEFDGNILAECVYVNLAPSPYWYDFVVEYDFSGTDPTEMAFIF